MVLLLIRRVWRQAVVLAVLAMLGAFSAKAEAQTYAAMVMDARTGKVLYARNADARLHPASLTKMMTLYIAFEAIEHGEITLDTPIRISANAAAEPKSKLGLKAGQTIRLRYCIRAAAIKSANDCATAIGEAIAGSEAAFARRMNRTARALGMTRSTFKNANGLTEAGHLSTARDMTKLGRHLFYDYPQYYNLFSRREADAGIARVSNTNRRLLASYRGADGIKTGYTRAAGFNLVASAERGGERIIATVFGGKSSASRNAKVAELLDLGFSRAPSRVAVNAPRKPAYVGPGARPASGTAGKTIRLVTAVRTSPRPAPRPGRAAPETAPAPQMVARLDTTPMPRPEGLAARAAAEPRVVARLSTSGGRHWGINVGRYGSEYEAQRVLLQTALMELETLDEALRKIVPSGGGFDANFVGMTEETADLACRRLSTRGVACETLGPG